MANVTLNDQALGTVWCAPWRVRLPAGVLRERDNVLEITVANLWINRLGTGLRRATRGRCARRPMSGRKVAAQV